MLGRRQQYHKGENLVPPHPFISSTLFFPLPVESISLFHLAYTAVKARIPGPNRQHPLTPALCITAAAEAFSAQVIPMILRELESVK